MNFSHPEHKLAEFGEHGDTHPLSALGKALSRG
jgi:hypothetical protein